MPTSKDFSVEDEAYLSTIAEEPKMTMDEVGADIEEHGHVPVTPETATQDPFTAKGSLSYALDEALADDTSLEHNTMTSAQNIESDSKLANPTDDFRDETKGEVEGTNSTPQGLIQPLESNKVGEGNEPTIQQDKAVHEKDSLAEALDAITMDGAEEIESKPPVGKDPETDLSKYNEEEASHIPLKAPKIPPSLGGAEDTPDENGLVYVTATFTVDPDKYVSNNYRPTSMGKAPNSLAALKQKRTAMNSKPSANPEEEAALSDLGTPEAKESAASPDEPTPQQEEEAAKDADKEQKEEVEVGVKEEPASAIPTPKKDDKSAQDEAPEKVVMDYATFIDGSSFICFDEVADIDYSKIAMDAGPKKAPTRANCQTTFAQCRAQNPLFCRFHGPKLLEADIKTAIKATVGPGCVVQVTKDKNSKNKFTFRLTVGCPPSKKKMVEKMVHMYLTQNPGITSSTEDWNLVGKHKQTQEFEMDILQADKPPKKDTKADQMLSNTKKAIKEHKKQDVVGETAPGLEKKAAKGEKWQTVDEDIENEWADLVDKTVHKSLLGNNEEFLSNFNKIANQFDNAHDAGNAEGLKQSLEALKGEIGKYDEATGEKKNITEEEDSQETAEGPEENSIPSEEDDENVQKESDEEQNEVAGLPDEDINPWYWKAQKQWFPLMDKAIEMWGTKEWDEKIAPISQKYGEAYKAEDTEAVFNAIEELKNVLDGKQSLANRSEETVLPSPSSASNQKTNVDNEKSSDKKNEALDKVKKALAGTGYENGDFGYDDFGDTQEVYIATSGNGEGTLEAVIGKDGNLTFGVHDNNGFSGNSEDPSHAISDFEKNYGGKPPAQSDGGNAISSLQNELSGLMDKMLSLNAITDADVFAMQHMCNYHMEELNAAKSSLDEIEAKINSVSENSSGDSVADAMSMSVLEEAKKKAQDAVDENIAQMKGSIKQFTDSLYSYEKATMENAKKGAADSVEQTVKNLGVYVFGGKRPPQGVDSVTDYLDYLKDEFESGAAGTLTPDEQSEIEDTYFLEDAYKATKAASKEMDDAIAAFKDKMDEVPSQGEGYGTYQAEIEQMQKAVASQAAEVMSAFGAYKSALEKCNDAAEAAKKLADSKKKLEQANEEHSNQGENGNGEGVTKADLIDFFGNSFFGGDEVGEKAMALWLELANRGTIKGQDPKAFLTSLEGSLQDICKEKGANHPMTKALVKAGLKLPKSMEENVESGNQVNSEKIDGGMDNQEQTKKQLSDEEKKAKIAAMSPKQKLEAAIKIFKKKLAANPNDETAKAKLSKYEAMLAKLGK